MTPRGGWAGALFLAVYALMVLPFAAWPWAGSAWALLAFALYVLLALGFALELSELVLALLWPPCPVARGEGPPPRHKAAVLMTVCDDWNESRLSDLSPLAAAGYRVFLLDDGTDSPVSSEVIPQGVVHLRRAARRGAKAGNLNAWLERFGRSFEYAVILDADSVVSVAAADALLLSAEHPDNVRTAVFQAKIEPAPRPGSLWASSLSVVARPRMRILERVHGPLGVMLSCGHNQLLRLAPIRRLGGFDETLTAEDTALSLKLAAWEWKVSLVDVWTRDEDPETVTAYNRRTLRWARQTVELFRRDWWEVPLRLKLLLCRHLLMYLLPVAGILLLILSLWNGPRYPRAALGFLASSLWLETGYVLYGLSLWTVFLLSLLFVALRVALARREGVGWRNLLLAAVLGNAPLALLLFPLALALLSSVLGASVRFLPTNSRIARRGDARLLHRVSQGVSLVALIAILVAGGWRRPGSLFVGSNLIWCILLFTSPVSLLILRISRWGRRIGADGS